MLKLLTNIILIGVLVFLISKISNKNIFDKLIKKIKGLFSGKEIKNDNKKIINNVDLNNIVKNENIISQNNYKNNENNENYKILNKILNKKLEGRKLPVKVSIPKECEEHDYINIINFINESFNSKDVKITNKLNYIYNINLYEIKDCRVNLTIFEKDLFVGNVDISFNILFVPSADNNIFKTNYSFNRKFGKFVLNEAVIINIRDVGNVNLINKDDVEEDFNSINSLIPDNIVFSSEYQSDSVVKTTESNITIDTAMI